MIRFPEQIQRHSGINGIATSNLVQTPAHGSIISLGKIFGMLVKVFQVRRLLSHTSLPRCKVLSCLLCKLGEKDITILMCIS